MASFSVGIKKFGNMTLDKYDRVFRKTALDIYKSIIDLGPVDTGRFRQNNMISIDKEINYSKLSDTKETKGSLMSEAKETLSGQVAGKVIYIQNNLEYAETIEYGKYPNPVKYGTRLKEGTGKNPNIKYEVRSINGFSTQAPAGVYGVTVLRFSHILKTNFNKEKLKG